MSVKLPDNLIKNIFSTIMNRGGVILCSMITSVLLARCLNPEKLGRYTVAITLYSICFQIANMGLHAAHSYYLSKDIKMLSKVWGNSLVVSIFSSFFCILFMIVIVINKDIVQISFDTLVIALCIVPVYLLNYYQGEIFIITGDVKYYNILAILVAIISLIGTTLFWAMDLSHTNIFLLLQIIVYFIASCLGAVRILSKYRVKPTPSLSLFKDSMPIGIKSFLACILAYLVLRADILMVQYYLDAKDTGLYSLAVHLADILNTFAAIFGMILFPNLMNLEGKKDRIALTQKIKKILILTLISAAVIGAVGGYWVIPFIYGENYRRSYEILVILLPGIILWSIINPLIAFFNSYKRYDLSIYAGLIALVTNVIFNFILIPLLGVTGAALASTFSYGVSYFYWNVLFYKQKRNMVTES